MPQPLLIIAGISLIISPGWYQLATETLHWDSTGVLLSILSFLGLLGVGIMNK